VAVGANDLLQDVASTFGPDKWFWIDVVVNHVVVDGGDIRFENMNDCKSLIRKECLPLTVSICTEGTITPGCATA
jgi:hypothetical protein